MMKNNKKTIIIVIVCVLVAIASTILLPVLTDIIKKETENTINKMCCVKTGGIWGNNTCTSGGNNLYDQDTYDACVAEEINEIKEKET